MPYNHKINTHHRAKRASRLKKFAQLSVLLFVLAAGWVAVDYVLTRLQSDTVVSVESTSTVQSAQINIFKTEYYKFQADSSWREVTDELTFDNSSGMKQYLYRRYDGNFIEHELFITVNEADGYKILRHNLPTRVLPIDVDAGGRFIAQAPTSDSCLTIQDKDNPNLTARDIEMSGVTFFCNPNATNDYVVAIGLAGGTQRIPIKTTSGEEAVITVTYRNITVNPSSRQLELILSNFKIN